MMIIMTFDCNNENYDDNYGVNNYNYNYNDHKITDNDSYEKLSLSQIRFTILTNFCLSLLLQTTQ